MIRQCGVACCAIDANPYFGRASVRAGTAYIKYALRCTHKFLPQTNIGVNSYCCMHGGRHRRDRSRNCTYCQSPVRRDSGRHVATGHLSPMKTCAAGWSDLRTYREISSDAPKALRDCSAEWIYALMSPRTTGGAGGQINFNGFTRPAVFSTDYKHHNPGC